VKNVEKSKRKAEHRQNGLMGGWRRIGKAFHVVTHTGGNYQ
jgi:hypothetical protein